MRKERDKAALVPSAAPLGEISPKTVIVTGPVLAGPGHSSVEDNAQPSSYSPVPNAVPGLLRP